MPSLTAWLSPSTPGYVTTASALLPEAVSLVWARVTSGRTTSGGKVVLMRGAPGGLGDATALGAARAKGRRPPRRPRPDRPFAPWPRRGHPEATRTTAAPPAA